jgi:ribosomal protein S18 acetylase RimI-like enzyme
VATAEVRLRPVTKDEFDYWRPLIEAGYAEKIAASGAMPAAAAREKARLDHARVLPNGLDSPGALIYRLLDGDQPVGWLWLRVPGGQEDPLQAWVSMVEVDAGFRGRGYGRAAMVLAEQEARERGMTSIGLNVHGHNTVARGLYDDLGYDVTTLQMKKSL